MTTHPIRPNAPVHDELHPLVYRTLVGLTVWLVASIWLLFDRGTYVGLNLAVITVFFVILAAIPLLLALIWRRNRASDERGPERQGFRDWSTSEFSTWTGQLSGRDATLQILLPIAAVAVGMTIFGLVFYFAVPSLS